VDLAGFTALTEAHGDVEALDAIRAFRERALACLEDDAHLVKTIGDALMLAFPEPETAVEALCRILEGESSNPHHTLLPRAGAHHGTAIAEDGDYVGAAVNLASRVAGVARGGQIVATTDVAVAARAESRVVSSLGPTVLRNITGSIDLWEIHVSSTDLPSAFDPVCSMRVPTEGPAVVSLTWDDRRAWFCGLTCASRFAAAPQDFVDRLGRGRPEIDAPARGGVDLPGPG
jgi:class 3 adenylate cyclase